jgi:DNA-binding NarL/FixJ family response regulator
MKAHLMPEFDGPIRVLIADDHPTFRRGLAALVGSSDDMAVVGQACDGAECIARFDEVLPDVTLMDLQMPVVDGLQAIAAIRSRFAVAAIVVLTTYPGDARVARAFDLGATSYLIKSADGDDILAAIRAAHKGEHCVGPCILQDGPGHDRSTYLTVRELTVLRLVAQGASNKEIARALSLSEAAVKARMKSILQRLGVTDRTHAVTTAMRRGFLD